MKRFDYKVSTPEGTKEGSIYNETLDGAYDELYTKHKILAIQAFAEIGAPKGGCTRC